jgi:large-conductance mechanosensitive channel
MEKVSNDFTLGLFLWQSFVFILILVVAYFLIKLYNKVNKYLDKNS